MSLVRSAKKFLYNYRHKHVLKVHETSEDGHSSHGQDLYIANDLLGHVSQGVFVEIGANDGVYLSNTYFFEKARNWSGIAVEPLPEAYKKLKENRACIAINGCVSDFDGETRFFAIEGRCEMLSGMPDRYGKGHVRRVRKNLKRHGATAREIVVPCYTLATLLERHGIGRVHYLSIDTEGGELDILRSIDFQRNVIDVISVENNYFDSSTENLMRANGYELVAIAGVDEIYRKRSPMSKAA